MEEKKATHYQKFEFVVEEMSDGHARLLMRAIVKWCERRDLSVGGGFHEVTDADFEEGDDGEGE